MPEEWRRVIMRTEIFEGLNSVRGKVWNLWRSEQRWRGCSGLGIPASKLSQLFEAARSPLHCERRPHSVVVRHRVQPESHHPEGRADDADEHPNSQHDAEDT